MHEGMKIIDAKLKSYRMAKLRKERLVDMAHRIYKLMLGRK